MAKGRSKKQKPKGKKAIGAKSKKLSPEQIAAAAFGGLVTVSLSSVVQAACVLDMGILGWGQECV
ncbi:MAG: hypothetical protein K2X47_14925 [Bdellovibrionales bacterium]|nr:hypothetical protein [Bdellovibrionales bacterium]